MRLSGNASISMGFRLTAFLRLFVFSCTALYSCNAHKSFRHFHHPRFHKFPHSSNIFWSTKPHLPWQFYFTAFSAYFTIFSVCFSALDQGPGWIIKKYLYWFLLPFCAVACIGKMRSEPVRYQELCLDPVWLVCIQSCVRLLVLKSVETPTGFVEHWINI